MSKLIYKSLNKFLPGYPGCALGLLFFRQINLREKKFFFAYIPNRIGSKKLKQRRTGSSDKKKIQKVIHKNTIEGG